MGTLVAKRYPAKIPPVGKVADHTYVECGTGKKGWKCFGGKSGGSAFRQGHGSTKQANRIGGSDEDGGLRCYLINGVCHQAANRTLYPASITVEGARGYGVSQAMFSTYGRLGALACKSPFNKYEDVSGDLAQCVSGDVDNRLEEAYRLSARDQLDAAELRAIQTMYQRYGMFDDHKVAAVSAEEAEEFHVQLFAVMAQFRLANLLGDAQLERLLSIRRGIEQRHMDIEKRHAAGALEGSALAVAVNALTIDLQEQFARELTDAQYESLLGLRKGDLIVLADPEVIPYG